MDILIINEIVQIFRICNYLELTPEYCKIGKLDPWMSIFKQILERDLKDLMIPTDDI